MQIQGKIKLIGPIQQISDSFSKREFVVTTEEQYPQSIQVELHGSNVDIIDPYQIGEIVKVSINLRGREWINPNGEAKYFNTIIAWRIERISTNTNSTEPTPLAPLPPVENYNPYPEKNNSEEDIDSDLPF